ncbi:uncharacterized protein LOC111248775 [Varroa destructor]|uniref:Dynamin-type G domain-containing protein n=1 Tax=Varroa destructor TaxID=109461 RepID=A0A7M7JUR1_VARDE|nr:uncharacterized protein LOC111248775 [Varroa destructor]
MPLAKFFTFHRGEYDARVRKGNEVTVSDALKELYGTKILPLEKHYNYEDFFSTPLEPAYFESKPLVLLFGEYSTGKTSFIKYVLGKEYPGMRIGPEPTTDNFIVVEYGEDEGIVPGNALVVDKTKQYSSLAKFGGQFLNRFQCSTVHSEILERFTLVDTPGILSGEKERGYDLTAVLRWFAERCDRIILLFDINKLDISDELRAAIDMVKGYEDKIKIVLNKSDTVNTQQLMRVYGALMWSLGKVMATPEAARVYIGSFWENPWVHEENRHLFEEEEADLIIDIYTLSRDADLRKLNDLVRRAKNVRIHSHIMAELRRCMPVFGISSGRRKKRLLLELSQIYEKLQMEYQLPPGDFPSIKEMRRKLQTFDFNKIRARKRKYFDLLNQALEQDIGRLFPLLPAVDQEDLAAKDRERQMILNKVWSEKMLLRRPIRPRGVSTVSSENLSNISEVESGGDHQTQTQYQKISSLPTPVVIIKEELSSGGSSPSSRLGAIVSGVGTIGTLKRSAPSPHLEKRTIITRTESTTLPSKEQVIRTETAVATPEKTEVKTTETTVVDGRTKVKESTQLKPADPHLASYAKYQAPKVEALYATIQKKKDDAFPKVEEKKFDAKQESKAQDNKAETKDAGAAGASTVTSATQQSSNKTSETIINQVEPGKRDILKKIGETTKEKTEVQVEEKTTIIAITTPASSTVVNGGIKSNRSIKKSDQEAIKLPLNIQETPAEEKEDKILNTATSTKVITDEAKLPVAEEAKTEPTSEAPPTTKTAIPSESKEEQRRRFLFGVTSTHSDIKQRSEQSIILKEMKESYDQSSIKDYDGIINDS